MKRNSVGMMVGALCVGVAVLALFTFQVAQTESVVVTTFGRFERAILEPGLYGRWCWPIQRLYRFDNRLRTLERKFEQTTTADGRNLVVSVFAAWRISNPRLFLERFPQGDVLRAEQSLEGLMRDAKNGVIGQHRFGELISTNRSRVRLREIEQDMLSTVRSRSASHYGIEVEILGLKQVGLPESITTKVFERMRAERQRLVKQVQSEGEAEAIRIRSEADRRRQEVLSRADADSMVIRGQGEAEAARAYEVFERNPELAVFLIELNALANSLKERSTLVFDPTTPPFTLLRGQPETQPVAPTRPRAGGVAP